MAITAAMVKELREMTGAGMMDCKKALNEVDGDMDKAVEFLREKGLAAAAKKASRIAAEGIVATLVSDDKKSAAIVEVNAETDFVAKNEVFQSYVARVAAQVLASNNTTMEAFMAEPWIDDASFTVEQELSQMVAKIGEKLSIRRFEKVTNENGVIASMQAVRSVFWLTWIQQHPLKQLKNAARMFVCRLQLLSLSSQTVTK